MGKLIKMSWRNVWRNWRRTMIAVIAITLGLSFMIFYNGMLEGAAQAIYGNAVKLMGGNILVHASGYREKARQMPLLPIPDVEKVLRAAQEQTAVVATSRRINTSGMVSSREGTYPVGITGIEPEVEAGVGLIADNISQGRFLKANDEDVILIGEALARQLEVGIGDRITLVGKATHKQMRRRTVTVAGIYTLGMEEAEKNIVYISLSEAQTLYDLQGQSTEVAITLQSVGQEESRVPILQSALPGYEVDAWDTIDPSLKQTMEMEAQIMSIFGLIILMIVGIGILNLMLMAVFERTREIGLLAATGLKRHEILVLFLLEGLWIGLLGAIFGCLIGGLVVSYYGHTGMQWTTQEYSDLNALMGDRIYFAITNEQLVQHILIVLIIAALASLYPAWRASRREPAEALHYV
jgi:ABC-type lipoprotein release transport system permease subunit